VVFAEIRLTGTSPHTLHVMTGTFHRNGSSEARLSWTVPSRRQTLTTNSVKTTTTSLSRLGIYGMEMVEPVLLAGLISGEPMLLIGAHGTGKSYLLNRLSSALGLDWRHYNASLLNFDDLIGYPLPDDQGQLRYMQTPSAIWGAESVFFDEISRCRPDMQNKLFPIIHERRCQGIKLERLVYRWSAMNPPDVDNDDFDGNGYLGSEPLDSALADRFAFVVEMPDWGEMKPEQQEQIIACREDDQVSAAAATRLRGLVDSGRASIPSLAGRFQQCLVAYVRVVMALLAHGDVNLSARRGGILLRNILAVHAAQLQHDAAASLADSAWLALLHGIPQRATGVKVSQVKLLTAHREAWKAAPRANDDPLVALLTERDPLKRVTRACQLSTLDSADLSSIVADALAALPPGGRHALAASVFETSAAGRLVAAVAEECAQLYSCVAIPQELAETVQARDVRHRTWQRVIQLLARMPKDDSETELTTNLLVSQFSIGEINSPANAEEVLAAWQEHRRRIRELAA
jgi:MoxR-like ATPase